MRMGGRKRGFGGADPPAKRSKAASSGGKDGGAVRTARAGGKAPAAADKPSRRTRRAGDLNLYEAEDSDPEEVKNERRFDVRVG